jgi:hypothetical protein
MMPSEWQVLRINRYLESLTWWGQFKVMVGHVVRRILFGRRHADRWLDHLARG